MVLPQGGGVQSADPDVTNGKVLQSAIGRLQAVVVWFERPGANGKIGAIVLNSGHIAARIFGADVA